jgi:hypothetical protein
VVAGAVVETNLQWRLALEALAVGELVPLPDLLLVQMEQ